MIKFILVLLVTAGGAEAFACDANARLSNNRPTEPSREDVQRLYDLVMPELLALRLDSSDRELTYWVDQRRRIVDRRRVQAIRDIHRELFAGDIGFWSFAADVPPFDQKLFTAVATYLSRQRATTGKVELSEVEVKFTIEDLGKLPPEVTAALINGDDHASILRRGLVLQEYVPVTPANLSRVFALTKQHGVPFGSDADQAEYLRDGVAKEIRMMTKSIRIGARPVTLRQLTIKGAGGVTVAQIESPEDLDAGATAGLTRIFAALSPAVNAAVRKIYFEVTHGSQAVEIDIFLTPAGVAESPIFMNGEIEFHGPDATAQAQNFRRQPHLKPSYLDRDITEAAGYKSRDIAARGVPGESTATSDAVRAHHRELIGEIATQFRTWADRDLAAKILNIRRPDND